MAYLPQQIPNDEENKFGRTGDTTPSPTPAESGGSSGAATSGGGSSAAPGVGSSTQFGSNAAKLSDYLKANEPQVKDFGNQVAGNLTQNYNDTMQGINQGVGAFNQQVNQGYTPGNQELVSRAAADPTNFAKSKGDVDAFKSIYNDEYKGPENFESSNYYSNTNNNVNKAVEGAALTGSSAGLGSYLNNYMNAGGGSPAIQTLDTALLQRSPEARTAIQNAATPFQNLSTYLGGKTAEANQGVANAKKTAADTRQGVRDQFGNVISQAQTGFNDRLAGARNAATQKSGDIMNKIMNGILPGTTDTSDLQQGFTNLGINPGEAEAEAGSIPLLDRLYGQKFNPNLITQQNADVAINPTNFANQGDYDQFAALQSLTGNDMSGFLNPQNSGQAGTAPSDLLDFNPQEIRGATVDNLRNQRMTALGNILGKSPIFADAFKNPGQDPFASFQLLNDPTTFNQVRNSLTGQDLKQFDDATDAFRVGPKYSAPPATGGGNDNGVVTGQPAENPNSPVRGFGGSYVDPRTGNSTRVY